MEIKRKSFLKETPEYEGYTENVVEMTMEELKELGLLSCGACSKKENGGCGQGCNCKCKKSSCKNK